MTRARRPIHAPARHRRPINRAPAPWLVYGLPYASILIGSILPALALAGAMPIVPPLGFITLIAWRMLRPGLIPPFAGALLGAFDDLFSGQPFGSGIALFSLASLALEWLDRRFPWRNYLQDWASAAMIIALYLLASIAVSGAELSAPLLIACAPVIALSMLIYPVIARIVAALDRLRLTPIAEIA